MHLFILYLRQAKEYNSRINRIMYGGVIPLNNLEVLPQLHNGRLIPMNKAMESTEPIIICV
jgi:hypothetical protein